MEGDDAGQCCFGTEIRCDSKQRVRFSHKLAPRTNPKVFRAMAALLEQVWGSPMRTMLKDNICLDCRLSGVFVYIKPGSLVYSHTS